MKINFFEEFPKKENLKKAQLINFKSLIFIAAKNLKEFNSHAQYLKKINKKITPAYWPVLKKTEGYWLSPFSQTKALQRVFKQLQNNKNKLTVLLDLEFPTHQPSLFIKNLFRFFKNKKIINQFINNKPKNLTLTTAEYILENKPLNFFLSFLGIHIKNKNISERIFMCYTSMARNNFFKELMYKNIQKHPSIGLGTIATGILGHEPILTKANLQKDLDLAKKSKVKTATIFRLGGLNKDYLKVINNFKSN
jgi:hypothetical protein